MVCRVVLCCVVLCRVVVCRVVLCCALLSPLHFLLRSASRIPRVVPRPSNLVNGKSPSVTLDAVLCWRYMYYFCMQFFTVHN